MEPEIGRRSAEDDSNASFAGGQLASVNDAAFLFGLSAGVGEKEALAADDGSFENEQAAVFAGVDGVDFFVERLLIRVRAVDKDGDDVRVAQASAVIAIVRVTGALAQPLLLSLF